MGIAELLEECKKFQGNWKQLFLLLRLDESKQKVYQSFPDFVVKATLMLRDWVQIISPRKANVELLCRLLEKAEQVTVAGR